MTGLLSLPSELLYKIIETCSSRERCHLRATCKALKEHADPIVFRRLRLYLKDPHITEHQIISLATQSSKACEFTRNMQIVTLPDVLQASEESWRHLGYGDDLRVYLPAAMSTLKNLTSFRWVISDIDPQWLIDSLMQTIAHLPHLTELDVQTYDVITEVRIPLSLFANLSKLSVDYCQDDVSIFISEMATVIANSPQLKRLKISYLGNSNTLRPTLSELFAETSTESPLYLKDLSIGWMDATVDQVVLPHLTHLTSFTFRLHNGNDSIARSVWTSFQVNHIKLSDVIVNGIITEETMVYLSSFSGLKRLSLNDTCAPRNITMEKLKDMLFTAVLPKHVNSLQTLELIDDHWVFDHASLKSITECLKLRDLSIPIDGKESGVSVQLLLDTVAHLPELKTLCPIIQDLQTRIDGHANFKLNKELRYAEKLTIGRRRFVLERDGQRPVRYREEIRRDFELIWRQLAPIATSHQP